MTNKSFVEIYCSPAFSMKLTSPPTRRRKLVLKVQRNPSYHNGLWPAKVPQSVTRCTVYLLYQNFKEEERQQVEKNKTIKAHFWRRYGKKFEKHWPGMA